MVAFLLITGLSMAVSVFAYLSLAFAMPWAMRLVFRSEAKLYRGDMASLSSAWNGNPPVRERAADLLAACFREVGFFPTYLRVCLAGDIRYPLQAMGEDFRRDGDIRWLVALFAPGQIFGRKEKPDPFSLPIAPGMPLVARMDFCLFNVLIAERLWIASETADFLDPARREGARRNVDAVVAALLEPPGGFHAGSEYLYKVSFDPGIRNAALNGMMKDWSAYYDSDSSAFALSLFSRYLESRRVDARFQDLSPRVRAALDRTPYPRVLASVHRPAETYTLPAGRSALPAGARAFLTYFTGEDGAANDADPVVNMDILEALAANWARWRAVPELAGQGRAALAYIRALAENGSLFLPWVNQYYTAPACAFLWKRCRAAWLRLDFEERIGFDPDGAVPAIDAAVETHWDAYEAADPGFEGLEDLDLALVASAFPQRRAAARRLSAWLKDGFARGPGEGSAGCREFFCAVYPVKVVYGSPHLMLALALGAEAEAEMEMEMEVKMEGGDFPP